METKPDASVNQTYRNILSYAAAIAGNEQVLAERIGVHLQQLLRWTSGIEPVPADIFLRAVDVVSTATPEEIRRSRRVQVNGDRLPPPERDASDGV